MFYRYLMILVIISRYFWISRFYNNDWIKYHHIFLKCFEQGRRIPLSKFKVITLEFFIITIWDQTESPVLLLEEKDAEKFQQKYFSQVFL